MLIDMPLVVKDIESRDKLQTGANQMVFVKDEGLIYIKRITGEGEKWRSVESEAEVSSWSKNTPDKSGFYWCHQYKVSRLVKVWRYSGEDERLFTSEDGGSLVTDHKLYKNALWFGPIEPPSNP